MVLTESQLRKVINEELKQYLIEKGFLSNLTSNIKDTAKSVYQKFTGGGEQKQQATATSTSSQTQPATKTASENIKPTLELNINNPQDITNFITKLNNFYSSNKRKSMLELVTLLHQNFLENKNESRYLQIYRKFINKLDEIYRHNTQVALRGGGGGTISQIRNTKQNVSEQKESKTTNIKDNVLLSQLLTQILTFFYKTVNNEKTNFKPKQIPDREKLSNIFLNKTLYNKFVTDVTGRTPSY